MYKRKEKIIVEQGYEYNLEKALQSDFTAIKRDWYLNITIGQKLVTLYCYGESYHKKDIDEYCNWVVSHYNEEDENES